MRARTATPDEREELWPRLVEIYADFENYQRWTERQIPVVILRAPVTRRSAIGRGVAASVTMGPLVVAAPGGPVRA